MFRFIYIFILSFLLFSNLLHAINSDDIPKALKGWEAWVLDDVKDRDCPINFQSNKKSSYYY